MMNVKAKSVAVASLAAIAVVGFSGCSSTSPPAQGTTSAIPATSMAAPAMTATTSPTADPAADLVGPGCSAYAAQHPSGPGSVAGMAQDPVATAASNNRMRTTRTAALSGKMTQNENLV